jgi:hypothetical protein
MALQRPNGEGATIWGGLSLVLGVIAAFIASGAETLQGFWMAIGIANLGIGLGVLLLSLGYLVRAIWFLPGREIEEAEVADPTALPKSNQFCDWCDQLVDYPYSPCSALDEGALRKNMKKITSAKCVAALEERGISVSE